MVQLWRRGGMPASAIARQDQLRNCELKDGNGGGDAAGSNLNSNPNRAHRPSSRSATQSGGEAPADSSILIFAPIIYNFVPEPVGSPVHPRARRHVACISDCIYTHRHPRQAQGDFLRPRQPRRKIGISSGTPPLAENSHAHCGSRTHNGIAVRVCARTQERMPIYGDGGLHVRDGRAADSRMQSRIADTRRWHVPRAASWLRCTPTRCRRPSRSPRP